MYVRGIYKRKRIGEITMVSLTMIEAVCAVIGYGLAGIAGNRADATVVSAYKVIRNRIKEGKEVITHDLERIMLRSFIRALKSICSECLDDLKIDKKDFKKDIQWLNEKRKKLNRELKKVKKMEYFEIPTESLSEIELFILPNGLLDEERIRSVKSKLVEKALENNDVPKYYKKKVEDTLFERMCAYFVYEYKENDRARDIFEGQILANIDMKLAGQQLSLDLLLSALNKLAEAKVPQIIEDIRGKLKELDKKADRTIDETSKIQKQLKSSKVTDQSLFVLGMEIALIGFARDMPSIREVSESEEDFKQIVNCLVDALNSAIGRLTSLGLGASINLFIEIGDCLLGEEGFSSAKRTQLLAQLRLRVINDIRITYGNEKCMIFELGHLTYRIEENLVSTLKTPNLDTDNNTITCFIEDYEHLKTILEMQGQLCHLAGKTRDILEMLKTDPRNIEWLNVELEYKEIYEKICLAFGLSGAESALDTIYTRNGVIISSGFMETSDESRITDFLTVLVGLYLTRLYFYCAGRAPEKDLKETTETVSHSLEVLKLPRYTEILEELLKKPRESWDQRSLIGNQIEEIRSKVRQDVRSMYGTERAKLMDIGGKFEALVQKAMYCRFDDRGYNNIFEPRSGGKRQFALLLIDTARDIEAIHRYPAVVHGMRGWAERINSGDFGPNSIEELINEILKWINTLIGVKAVLPEYVNLPLTSIEVRELIDMGFLIAPLNYIGKSILIIDKGYIMGHGIVVADIMAGLRLSEPLFLLIPILMKSVTEPLNKQKFETMWEKLLLETYSSVSEKYGHFGLSLFWVGFSIGNLNAWMSIAAKDKEFLDVHLSHPVPRAELENIFGEAIRTLSHPKLGELAGKIREWKNKYLRDGLTQENSREICKLCVEIIEEVKNMQLSSDMSLRFKPIL